MNLKRVHVHAVVLIISNTTTRKKWGMRNTKKDVFFREHDLEVHKSNLIEIARRKCFHWFQECDVRKQNRT